MPDLALFLARRLLDGRPAPLNATAVAALCQARGLVLLPDPELRQWAYYLPAPDRALLHRPHAPAWVLAHELVHDVVAEADPDTLAGRWDGTEEELADAVATLLCGPMPRSLRRERARNHTGSIPVPYHAPTPEELEDELPAPGALDPALLRLIDLLCAEARERKGRRRPGEAP